jgi:type II secretory pathway pseudopilin PulG
MGADPRDDRGVALLVVVGVMAILFILTTMLIATVNYTVQGARREEVNVKTLHMADAGLNAYLYELRRDPLYYVGHPSLAGAQEDGRWVVRATAPTTSSPLTLRSEATLVSKPASRSVVATVRFPTFADYMFLSNAAINVGAGATITGKVRTNGNLDNLGTITRQSYAVGTITGSGSFGTQLPAGSQTKYPGEDTIDFSQVTADTDAMLVGAQAAGSYHGPSGAKGYRITFSGTTYTLEKVTAIASNGTLTTTFIAGPVSIPAVGVIYIADDVWVRGSYNAAVTVCSSQDIYVPENLRPTDANSIITCGLVAQRNIIVPTWYASVPNDMTLTAAMLAQTGSIYGDLKDGYLKNSITITGSSSYYTYGYFVRTVSGSPVAGFRTRTYTYDDRLDLFPPPKYPVVHDGSLKINTWIED